MTSSLLRKVSVALALVAPLLFSVAADASPVRRAHARPHRATHRTVSPAQAFARIATHRPERRVYRHPPAWLKSTRGGSASSDSDAAIQTTVAPASTEVHQDAPALRPLGLLVSEQAQPRSHDGFAQSSPRAPPACG